MIVRLELTVPVVGAPDAGAVLGRELEQPPITIVVPTTAVIAHARTAAVLIPPTPLVIPGSTHIRPRRFAAP
jgi:hypothetical protein